MSTSLPCWLNGEWLNRDEARVPVMDRGFLFGDGVYEVIPVYGGRPFRLDEHLHRLTSSLSGIGMDNPLPAGHWHALIGELIARSGSSELSIYLQITRGVGAVRNHAFPPFGTPPTVFLMAEPLSPPPAQWAREGVAAITAADIRWLHCHLKTTSLLANCLLRQMAVAAGCLETILLRDGFLTEGAASSIFVVRDGMLLAPIKNHLMLPGITYEIVLELAAAHGLPCAVRDITVAELRAADELWLCSSTREVVPIVKLDGQPVGSGQPGPHFAAMHQWYQSFKASLKEGAV